MSWPDILIGVLLLIPALKGFKRGFIMELAGAFALLLSLITPWFYNGAFDATLRGALRVGAGAAHVIALFLVGLATYVAIMLAARALSAVAKMPIIGTGNAVAGAAVGLIKGAVFVWLLLYIALFFPLSPALRRDFHASPLVRAFAAPDATIDDRAIATLPSFARPFLRFLAARHRV